MSFLRLPGSTGQNARTPTTTNLDVTNDLDIMVRLNADTAVGNTLRALIGRRESSSTFAQIYNFAIESNDRLSLNWTTAADVDLSGTASTTAAVQSGLHWLRATLDVDNGASGYDLKFWYSTTATSDPDSVSWTQIGSTVVGGATTDIIDGRSAKLEVGGYNDGSQGFWAADLYRGVVRNGIGGTIIANFDADLFSVGATAGATANDSTGKTWTLFGAGVFIVENLAGTGASTLGGDTSAGSGTVVNPSPPPSGERVIRHPTYTPRRR